MDKMKIKHDLDVLIHILSNPELDPWYEDGQLMLSNYRANNWAKLLKSLRDEINKTGDESDKKVRQRSDKFLERNRNCPVTH